MREQTIEPGHILSGALFNGPMRVETVRANGPDVWDVGLVGVQSDRFRFLQLLDRDAYADVRSIRQAMDQGRAPFYLRRTKEAMAMQVVMEHEHAQGRQVFDVHERNLGMT